MVEKPLLGTADWLEHQGEGWRERGAGDQPPPQEGVSKKETLKDKGRKQ